MFTLCTGEGSKRIIALALVVGLSACSGFQGSSEQSTLSSLPNVSSHVLMSAERVPKHLPDNLFYAGACLAFARYCTSYGVDVYDANPSSDGKLLYTITQGIKTPQNANTYDAPNVAVDDSGNLYAGVPKRNIYPSDPAEVLVYPPGQVTASATLTGFPDVDAIATSTTRDVAVQGNDGTVYTFAPGTTTPQRTITCKKYQPGNAGGVGYDKNGSLFFGVNYVGTKYSNTGYIFEVAPGEAKCGRPILSTNTYGATLASTAYSIGHHELIFDGNVSGVGIVGYFIKGSKTPSYGGEVNSLNALFGLAVSTKYVYLAGDGSAFRVPVSCIYTYVGGCNPDSGAGYTAESAAVYPRAPIGSW